MNDELKDEITRNIENAQKTQKIYFDATRSFGDKIQAGQKVFLINAARIHRMGGKLTTKYLGPYEVIGTLPKGHLCLHNLKNMKVLKKTCTAPGMQSFTTLQEQNINKKKSPIKLRMKRVLRWGLLGGLLIHPRGSQIRNPDRELDKSHQINVKDFG